MPPIVTRDTPVRVSALTKIVSALSSTLVSGSMSDINAIASTGRPAGSTLRKVGGDDMVLGNFRALCLHVHLGKADLRYIVKMASDRIDPATVTFSEIIYEPVCDLYDVGLVIEHNEQRLFAKASP